MNNRDYKCFAPQTTWHIYNRGNAKDDIFIEDDDYRFYLYRWKESLFPTNKSIPLKMPIKGLDGHLQGQESCAGIVAECHTQYIRKSLPKQAFTAFSYCLMPNHFHFIIRQNSDVPISKLVSKINTSYSKNFNNKYERVGGLWQDQFKAALIDNDKYLLWLSAYIHNNPKVAGLVQKLEDWPWSSYLDYAGLRQGTLCDKNLILSQFESTQSYLEFVAQAEEKTKTLKDIQHFLLDE